MPILLNLRWTLQPQTTEAETQSGDTWDLQAIADCVRSGDKRVEFLQPVENPFEQAKQKFEAIREDPTPDANWSLWG